MAEDWAAFRVCPYPKLIGEKIVDFQFRGPGAHWEVEQFANQWILQRYGRKVEWVEVNPWEPFCDYLPRVISGGPFLPVYFTIG